MVKFLTGLLSQYNSLLSKDSDTLYFITDKKRIYKGDTLITMTSVMFVDVLPEGAEIMEDVLYVLTTDNTIQYHKEGSWVKVGGGKVESGSIVFSDLNSEMVASTISDSEPSASKVVTEEAVATYVNGVKSDIEALVGEYGSAFKSVSVGDSETPGKFALVFTDFNEMTHSIDLDKEKFLKSASLDPDGTTLNLTLTDDTVVQINLAEVVADAATVKTTEDIVVTTTVGELIAGTTVPTGTSVQDIMVKILSKEKDPTKNNPSISTFTVTNNGSGTDFEAGTQITPKWNMSFNPGSYTYKSTVQKEPITPVSGTGVTATSYEVFKGTASDESIGSAATGTGSPFTLEDSNVTFTARINHSDGNYALTNLNKLPEVDVRIVAGSVTKTAMITTFRKMFAGSTTSAGEVNSDLIRSLETSQKASKTTFEFKANVSSTKVLLAFPATLTGSDPTFEYFTMSWESFSGFTKVGTVLVSDVRGGENGQINYNVYAYSPASPFEAETKFRAIIK